MKNLVLNSGRQTEALQAALEYEIYSYNEVVHYHAHYFLGAFLDNVNQEVTFRYYNPFIEAVSVVGDFNNWNPKTNPMNKIHASGYWELRIKGAKQADLYQFAIFAADGENIIQYINDPYALGVQLDGRLASSVENRSSYIWQDHDWIAMREKQDLTTKPISVYSYDFADAYDAKTYQELAKNLASRVKSLGFTHIEFKNFIEKIKDCVNEEVDYQLFVPCLALGRIEDFKCLIDYLHKQDIGVIFDLPYFEIVDKSPMFDQNQFRNRFLSNVIYWLEEYHADGFSFEGFSELSYNDSNADTMLEFVKTLNEAINNRSAGVFTICKTNSVLPEMSLPTYRGGFGFNMKANFLFNRALFKIFHSLHCEPEDILATSFNAFAQNHILFADQQLIGAGPDDLKLLLVMLMTFPGKKLISEKFLKRASLVLGQSEADKLISKLNNIYCKYPVLFEGDFRNTTFEWLDFNSDYLSFLRWTRDYNNLALVVINTSAKSFPALNLGVPQQGLYLELLNSQADLAAPHLHSSEGLYSNKEEAHNRPYSLMMDLPAKTALVFTSKKL